MKKTTNSTEQNFEELKESTNDMSSTNEKESNNSNFFDLNEDYLTIENDEFIAIKTHPMSKNLGIIYNKETEKAYATYGQVALMELKSKTAMRANAEIETRRTELLMEFIAYTAFMSNQNKK